MVQDNLRLGLKPTDGCVLRPTSLLSKRTGKFGAAVAILLLLQLSTGIHYHRR